MSEISQQPSANQEWYRLDNAATLYTLISSSKITCIFRIEAHLKRTININRLQLALDNIIERFPYYRVNLMPGLFWHFWNTNLARPRIIADSEYPCEQMPLTKNGIFPFRVRAYKSSVAMEFHHSITDGTGALIFLQALLAEYLKPKGVKDKKKNNIFKPGQTPELSEYEDAYKKYFKKSVPSPLKQEKVFSLPYKLCKSKPFCRTTGIIELDDINPVIKKLNVSITEFLSAVFLYSFQDILFNIPGSKRKRHIRPIRIMVPVNMRKIYPSATMRNFSLYVNPEIDPRLGRYSFSDILKQVYHYMRVEVNEKYISKQIKRNVRAELHPLLRVTPLFLKKLILRIATTILFSRVNNGVLSNIGRIEMPSAIRHEIENFQFLLPPSSGVKICLAIAGYKEKLYLNFARIYREAEVEKQFFRKLVKMGIKVKII
ncbi:MAG: hypothetical protein JW822_10810 [Spirochaetales bacterium]|nr:hypothetical protein [Spirochaetales bacterium]